MNDFIWQSLATPILVALITTLVVEYSAKPRLEARKARILRSRVEVDEFVYAAQRVGLLTGALPEAKQLKANPALVGYAHEAVSELEAAVADAARVLSRPHCPLRGCARSTHREDAAFLGLLREQCRVASVDPVDWVDGLKTLAGDLENFDVYFRVHLGLGDNQEPLVKRLFWRVATQDQYAEQADATLARHGLPVP